MQFLLRLASLITGVLAILLLTSVRTSAWRGLLVTGVTLEQGNASSSQSLPINNSGAAQREEDPAGSAQSLEGDSVASPLHSSEGSTEGSSSTPPPGSSEMLDPPAGVKPLLSGVPRESQNSVGSIEVGSDVPCTPAELQSADMNLEDGILADQKTTHKCGPRDVEGSCPWRDIFVEGSVCEYRPYQRGDCKASYFYGEGPKNVTPGQVPRKTAAVLFRGEAFRSGDHTSRKTGGSAGLRNQRRSSLSHGKYLLQPMKDAGLQLDIFVSTARTNWSCVLLSYYAPYGKLHANFTNGARNQGHSFQMAVDFMTGSRTWKSTSFDLVLVSRLDLFFRVSFWLTYDPQTLNGLLWPSRTDQVILAHDAIFAVSGAYFSKMSQRFGAVGCFMDTNEMNVGPRPGWWATSGHFCQQDLIDKKLGIPSQYAMEGCYNTPPMYDFAGRKNRLCYLDEGQLKKRITAGHVFDVPSLKERVNQAAAR